MGNVVRHANRTDVLMEGKNLAVVTRYARVSPVALIRMRRSVANGDKTVVEFVYDDGAYCVTYWADKTVFLLWLLARRSWSVDRVIVNDGLYEWLPVDMLARIRKRGTQVLELR